MKPTRSILNPDFRYFSSANTSVARTFKRIRRELAEQAAKKVAPIVTIKRAVAK